MITVGSHSPPSTQAQEVAETIRFVVDRQLPSYSFLHHVDDLNLGSDHSPAELKYMLLPASSCVLARLYHSVFQLRFDDRDLEPTVRRLIEIFATAEKKQLRQRIEALANAEICAGPRQPLELLSTLGELNRGQSPHRNRKTGPWRTRPTTRPNWQQFRRSPKATTNL
jgi:hypothetical protein